HHPLPSFPTRRSSDLKSQRRANTSWSWSFVAALTGCRPVRSSDSTRLAHGRARARAGGVLLARDARRAARTTVCRGSRGVRCARSEEHTSELQSLRHL